MMRVDWLDMHHLKTSAQIKKRKYGWTPISRNGVKPPTRQLAGLRKKHLSRTNLMKIRISLSVSMSLEVEQTNFSNFVLSVEIFPLFAMSLSTSNRYLAFLSVMLLMAYK
jgi:hypothetical protein